MRLGLLELGLAALTGSGVGFLAGLFGVGGGFVLVPVLNVVLGIPMEIAVGSGACHVLGPATTSLLARKVSLAQARLPLTIFGGLLAGVLLGAHLLVRMQGLGDVVVAGRQIPLAQLVVLTSYFVLLSTLGLFAVWDVHRRGKGVETTQGWSILESLPPYAEFPDLRASRMSITTLAWFGVAVGFLSGLLGTNGGIVVLPGMIYALGMKTHQAVLRSLVIVWLISVQSTAVHAWHDNVDLYLVSALLLGGTLGARIGSEISGLLGGPALRKYFGWLLLGTAVMIAAKFVHLFTSGRP